MIPQLKPDWQPVTADRLAELLASESLVFVARQGGRIVGLTVMVPHRHLPGLRYHVEDVVIDHAPGVSASVDGCSSTRWTASRSVIVRPPIPSPPNRAHGLYTSLGFVPSDTTVFRLDTPRPS